MALLQSIEDKTFAANVKQIAHYLINKNEKKELEKLIYAQLIAKEFYLPQDEQLPYDDLKIKAKESADAFFND